MADHVYVKYCPLCGAENPRQQAFCLACLDGNLSTVPAEPKRAAVASPPSVATASPSTAQNNDAATVASALVPDTRQLSELTRCQLELIDDPQKKFLIADGQTVGRSSKADVVLRDVPKVEWISSAHARFSRRGEQWYVQHIGKTNFIKVDGEIYRGTEEVALHDGSILVLSLTAFRVSLGGN